MTARWVTAGRNLVAAERSVVRGRGGDWLGCDVGGSAIKLVRLRGRRVLARGEVPTPQGGTGVSIADLLARVIDDFALTSRHGSVCGVGVAVPGFLDARRERIVRLSNLPAWAGLRLRSSLERRLRIPVRLDADTNAGAIAEAWTGAARRDRRVLYLALGTGVGAAFVVDRRLARAAHNTVGHVGHLPVCAPRDARSAPERIERALGARGIATRARRAGLREVDGPLALAERARTTSAAERRIARRLWREIGADIARAGAAIASLFLPEVVVLGGGTTGASGLFLRAAERGLHRAWPRDLGPVPRLIVAAHGSLAGAIGAAYLARQDGAS